MSRVFVHGLIALALTPLLLGSSECQPVVLFTQSYGGPGTQQGTAIATSDGDYLIGGTTSATASTSDLLFIKTDAHGNQIWSRSVDGGGFETLRSFRQVSDGGFLALGTTQASSTASSDVYLVKLAADGGVLWAHSFGGSASEDPAGFVEMPWGYAIAASTMSYGPDAVEVWLLRVGFDGQLLKARVLTQPGGGSASGIAPTPDGGLVIVGTNGQGPSNTHGEVFHLEASGAEDWQEALAEFSAADAVVVAPDGSIVVGGSSDATGCTYYYCYDSGHIAELDAGGRILWQQTEQVPRSFHGDGLAKWIWDSSHTILVEDGGTIVENRAWEGMDGSGIMIYSLPEIRRYSAAGALVNDQLLPEVDVSSGYGDPFLYASALVPTGYGEFAITLFEDSPKDDGTHQPTFFKLGSDFHTETSVAIPWLTPVSVAATSDGGFLVSGGEPDVTLVKMGPNGETAQAP